MIIDITRQEAERLHGIIHHAAETVKTRLHGRLRHRQQWEADLAMLNQLAMKVTAAVRHEREAEAGSVASE